MKLVPTEHIPGRCAKHDLQKLIEEFINGEAKVCLLYTSPSPRDW